MADTVDINAQGDATAVEAKVAENTVESTETVATPETAANDETNKTQNETASDESTAVKRKAEDLDGETVDESKKSKVEQVETVVAVENGHPTNGHTEDKPAAVEEVPSAVEETPAVESTEDLPEITSKTVEDVERLKAAAEENVAA
jgi:hypothetical protein